MTRKIAIAVAALSALLMIGCKPSRVKISGHLHNMNASKVYLEKVAGSKIQVVDSAAVNNGTYKINIKNAPQTPSLYYLSCGGERVPLLLTAGERVVIDADSTIRNYTVSGSEESALLREFHTLCDGKDYIAAKHAQFRFIEEHKESMAAVYALYQRFYGEANLSNGDNDVIYYRKVAEAVGERWPDSPLVAKLRSDIANMEAEVALVANIKEVNYPDIKLPDMYGNEHRLSSLDGKVVLLSFWSVSPESNRFNADLKELYDNYSGSGFEVYQVCVGTSKVDWISSVQEQRLPWISVYDPNVLEYSALALYNVNRLPSNYILDREGNIVGRDIFGDELEAKLSQLLY